MERLMKAWLILLILVLLVGIGQGLTACGDFASSDASTDASDGDYSGSDVVDGDVADGDYNYSSEDGDVTDGDAIEVEKERRMSLPIIGKNHIFILNRQAGTLVMIDSITLAIRTIQVGTLPLEVATVPDKDVALVIDAAADKLSLVLADEGKEISWAMREDKRTGYNSISVSPTGEYALLYFNFYSDAFDIQKDPLGSIQEVGLVDLRDTASLTALKRPIKQYNVGINPQAIQWQEDGSKAFVISDRTITTFDFSEDGEDPNVTPNIQLEDNVDNPIDREVKITPDGHYCILRRFDSLIVTLIDLERQQRRTIEFEAQPTDLDITADGSRAIIIARDAQRLAVVPIPEGFVDQNEIQWVISPEGAGLVEVGPDGNTMLFYSSRQQTERVWMFRLSTGDFEEIILQKGIESITFAPVATDGELTALVFHTRENGRIGPDDDLYSIIDKSHGYTVLHLTSGIQVLQLTDADQGDFTFTPEGDKGYVLVTDENSVRQVQILDMMAESGAQVRELNLGSVPTGVGLIPQSGRVYVSQDHPDGRITFIDTETDDPITVTGFELNGDIE